MTSTDQPSVDRLTGDPVPSGPVQGRWVRRAGITAAGCALAAQLIAPAALDHVAGTLAVIGVLIGVPHGAVDHLVPFWCTGRRITVGALSSVLVRYVAVLAAALIAVLTVPLPTLWVFLGAAALHFGRGEVVAAADAARRPAPRPWQDLAPMLAHGAVTVGLPLAAWGSVSLPVLDRVAPGFAGTSPVVLRGIVTATLVLVLLAGGLLLRAGRRAEAGELALLAGLFAWVPPLAAFGVYFGLWHAARHTLRLVSLPGADGTVDLRAGTVRYLRGAALPTSAAIALLVGLPTRGTGSGSLLAAELALLVGLTAPHLGSVVALDRWQAARTAGQEGPESKLSVAVRAARESAALRAP